MYKKYGSYLIHDTANQNTKTQNYLKLN